MNAPRWSGARVLRSDVPLGPYPARVTDDLVRWARERLTRRSWPNAMATAGARSRSRDDARARPADRRGAARNRAARRSGRSRSSADNGIDHAAIALGAIYAGVPAAPISTGYVRPAPIPGACAPLLGVLQPFAAFVPAAGVCSAFRRAVPAFRCYTTPARSTAIRHAPTARTAALGADSVAKILFTSGSTGTPKGVITTHRMLCANQTMVRRSGRRPSRPGARRLGAVESPPPATRSSGSRCATAARSTSMAASRRRARSTRRCATCARSRRRSTSTCRAAGRCCRPSSSATRRWRDTFFSRCACCSTRARASPNRSARVWRCSPTLSTADVTSRSSRLVVTETAPMAQPCGERAPRRTRRSCRAPPGQLPGPGADATRSSRRAG